MHKYEQKFCTELKKWLDHNWKENCFIEAKISLEDKPLNLKSGFKDHQLPCLMYAQKDTFSYKISDMDRMQKPFDIIHSYKIKTYIAIMWIRRGNKRFYLIDPVTIQGLIDDGHKSLTEAWAMVIADKWGTLK